VSNLVTISGYRLLVRAVAFQTLHEVPRNLQGNKPRYFYILNKGNTGKINAHANIFKRKYTLIELLDIPPP